MFKLVFRDNRFEIGPGCVALLAPIVLLLMVGGLAEFVRQSAQLSDPTLHKFAAEIAFDNWAESLNAGSRDYIGRLGWATAFAVFVPLWLVTVGSCIAILRREATDCALIALIPLLWIAEKTAVSCDWIRYLLPKTSIAAIAIGMLAVGLVAALKGGTGGLRRALWTVGIFLVGAGIGLWVLNGWQLYGWHKLQATLAISGRQLAIVAPPFDELLVRLEYLCNPALSAPCDRGIYSLDRLVGGLATIALGFLGLAAAVIIAEPIRNSSILNPASDSSPIRLLRRQRREFQRLLYVAASLLVVCVTVAKSLQQWPLSVIHDRAQAAELQLIADQWLVMLGTYWTLMLAAIFIPVAVALNGRGPMLSKQGSPSAEDENNATWLERNGFKTTTYEQCLTVLALLGPWLAGGPLASFANWMKVTGG